MGEEDRTEKIPWIASEKYLTFRTIVAIIILLLERLCYSYALFDKERSEQQHRPLFEGSEVKVTGQKTIYYLRRKT